MRVGMAMGLLVAVAAPAWGSGLELRRVVLSSAGTGYYEYEATVDGTVALPLDVRLSSVDDLLKSLVVFDSTGAVGAVVLPGRDDKDAAFGRVPFTAEALQSPAAYLNSLQGVEVSVQGPRPMQGRIMRADTVREPAVGPAQPGRSLTRVSLMTEGGLRQFVLEDSEAVQIVDTGLRDRVGQAVAATRRETAQDTRLLRITSAGPAGPRTVRVSYVTAAPLWKASYRMVLPRGDAAQGGASARLQGWATLENDTGADWRGIELALQYGNPVTFHQAIYRMYFAQRPEVPVEVLARLLPDVDTRARPVVAPAMARTAAILATPMAAAPAPAPPPMAEADTGATTEAATETVFSLSKPVDVPAGYSATVPILDVALPAARVDLATPGQEHPLDSIRIENTTGSSLPAGVLTLYDLQAAAPYAGDARLGGVPPGESRLLSYAQDGRTSIEWTERTEQSLQSLTAANGVLQAVERTRHLTTASIAGPVDAGRRVLIEVPKPDGATVAPGFAQPVESTATTWRFAADVAAGKVQDVTYALDTDETRTVALLRDPDAVTAVMSLPGASPAAQAALKRIEALRQSEAAAQRDRAQLAAQRTALEADEARIRDNLKALQPGDALRTRLLRQLDADETRLGDLASSLQAADKALAQAHTALADAVTGLSLQ